MTLRSKVVGIGLLLGITQPALLYLVSLTIYFGPSTTLGYCAVFVFLFTAFLGYYSLSVAESMKVLLIAQVVTWPPVLYAAAPSFAQNSGGLLDIFYLGFGALVFFGVSFVGLLLGSVARDLFEEFGQRPEKPYDEVHLGSLSDDALLEEYKALQTELDDDRAIKDPWDSVLSRRIEAELTRRGLKVKPDIRS